MHVCVFLCGWGSYEWGLCPSLPIFNMSPRELTWQPKPPSRMQWSVSQENPRTSLHYCSGIFQQYLRVSFGFNASCSNKWTIFNLYFFFCDTLLLIAICTTSGRVYAVLCCSNTRCELQLWKQRNGKYTGLYFIKSAPVWDHTLMKR